MAKSFLGGEDEKPAKEKKHEPPLSSGKKPEEKTNLAGFFDTAKAEPEKEVKPAPEKKPAFAEKPVPEEKTAVSAGGAGETGEGITEYLEKYFGISGLSESDKKDFPGLFETKTYKKDELIFRQNETGEEMYFVKKGLVKIYITELEGGKTIALMKEGTLFGEIALFDNQPRSAEAKSMGDTELLLVGKQKFNSLKETNPRLALKIVDVVLETFCKRLRGTTRKMYGLY